MTNLFPTRCAIGVRKAWAVPLDRAWIDRIREVGLTTGDRVGRANDQFKEFSAAESSRLANLQEELGVLLPWRHFDLGRIPDCMGRIEVPTRVYLAAVKPPHLSWLENLLCDFFCGCSKVDSVCGRRVEDVNRLFNGGVLQQTGQAPAALLRRTRQQIALLLCEPNAEGDGSLGFLRFRLGH